MSMHTDFARPSVRRWIKKQRPRLTWKRIKARIDIAWMSFDLWYSEFNVRMLTADLSTEIGKQADLKKALATARRAAA